MQFWKDRFFWHIYPAYALLTAGALYFILAGVEWLVAVLSTPEGIAQAQWVILAAFGALISGVLAALTAQHFRAGDDTTHGGK